LYPCHFFKDNSFVIDTNGKVFKCLALDSFPVGDIENGLNDNHIKAVEKYFQECKKCNLYPICGGGCRYKSFLRDGNLDKPYCEKFFLTELNKIIINSRI